MSASSSRSPIANRLGTRRALSPEGFYGWRIVAFSAIALALTAPGQTAAVSAFIDPMMADLGLSRSAISTAYMVGTLTGAAAMPWIGRGLDRFGVRRTMATIGICFGAILLSLSLVTEIVGLTAGFVGIRMAGQGALGLTATTAVALWFSRRRGFAVGLTSAIGTVGISLAPVGLERLIHTAGWQTAWVVEGLLVWAVAIPLALLGMRDRPADLGQMPDGAEATEEEKAAANWSMTRGQALRYPFFWVVASGVAVVGLLSTAVGFHQISLLGERGLSPVEAAANFVPQTAAGLVATLGIGAMIDRVHPRWVMVLSMTLLATGLLLGTVVTAGLPAIGFGMAIGGSGGAIRAVEAGAFPRYFGVRHIGAIRGIVVAISVASTAGGPLLFAVVQDLTGSYAPALLGSAAIPVLVAVASLLTNPPDPNAVSVDREPDEH